MVLLDIRKIYCKYKLICLEWLLEDNGMQIFHMSICLISSIHNLSNNGGRAIVAKIFNIFVWCSPKSLWLRSLSLFSLYGNLA